MLLNGLMDRIVNFKLIDVVMVLSITLFLDDDDDKTSPTSLYIFHFDVFSTRSFIRVKSNTSTIHYICIITIDNFISSLLVRQSN